MYPVNVTMLHKLNSSVYAHLHSRQIRNRTSEQFIDHIRNLESEGRLGHLSLGLCSVVFSRHINPELCEYGAVYLGPRWAEYLDRVVDVGLVGRWWNMEQAMEDYDINEDEWG